MAYWDRISNNTQEDLNNSTNSSNADDVIVEETVPVSTNFDNFGIDCDEDELPNDNH